MHHQTSSPQYKHPDVKTITRIAQINGETKRVKTNLNMKEKTSNYKTYFVLKHMNRKLLSTINCFILKRQQLN